MFNSQETVTALKQEVENSWILSDNYSILMHSYQKLIGFF